MEPNSYYKQASQCVNTKAVSPSESAANDWVAARERLTRARAVLMAAQAEVESAHSAESQAWSALEEAAGRGCSKPGPVGHGGCVR